MDTLSCTIPSFFKPFHLADGDKSRWARRFLVFVLVVSSSNAQRFCSDSPSPSPGCSCYPGLTNAPGCDRLSCGNPYENSTARAPFDVTLAGQSGYTGCGQQCTLGFTGSNCNVCQSNDSCQKGISSVSSSSPASSFGLSAAASGDVVCSKEQIAYTANFGECSIKNPTVQALLPGKLLASIQRYPDPSSASLPSTSLTGLTTGITTVQVLYAANTSAPLQEQFFCQATNCTQRIKDQNTYGLACSSLKCKCNPGSFLCGGGALDLTATINQISGDIGMQCPLADPSDSSSTTSTCNIQMGILKNIFGPQGFALSDCQFGECVQQKVMASKRNELFNQGKSSVNGRLVAALVIAIVAASGLVGLILFGFYRQHRARRTKGATSSTTAPARVEWSNLSYYLPVKSGSAAALRRRVRSVPFLDQNHHQSQEDKIKGKNSSSATTSFPGGVQILCGLSGSVEAGSMMAIMGPSGAGKSTLLDVLAGQQKVGKNTGRREIFFPGESEGCAAIGFVEQSDILPSTSTVREALMFSARLKLPEHLSKQEREVRVSEVIELLGLSRVADSRIGDDEKRGLSGGERRRLSIGLELIARPSVLFLDEPTSGLDSVSALRVVQVLKGLSGGTTAGYGTTVVCSIHQPNSQIYHSFDSVCLLALGGRQIYCGPTWEAVSYLESRGSKCPPGFNPADHLLEVASEYPESIFDRGQQTFSVNSDKTKQPSPEPFPSLTTNKQEDLDQPERRKESSSFAFPPNTSQRPRKPLATMITQIQVISQREWHCLKRDPSLFWFQNIFSIIVGVFVGCMFFQVDEKISGFQNRVGSLFFTSAILLFGSLSALTNFYRVRLLFMRERSARYYSPQAWLIVRAGFDLIPLRVLPILTMGTIIYWMVGLSGDGPHFLKFLLALLGLCLVQTTFNFWLAAMSRNLGTTIFSGSMINLLELAYAGFFVNLSSIPKVVRWIQYIVPFKFSLEAMTVNEVGAGLMIDDELQGIKVKVSASMIMKTLFGFDEDAYWRDVIILFGFFLFFTSLLVVTVIRKLKQVK